MAFTVFSLTNGGAALSGGGLIATSTSGTGSASSNDAYRVPSSRLIYFEQTFNVRASANTGAGFGVTNNPFGTSNAVLVLTNGVIFENGSNTGISFGALVNGDVICWAIDFKHNLYWARKNAGNWNNSATADPATGGGGRAFPIAIGAYVTPLANLGATSEQITLNAGASAFAQAAPSGFTGWTTPGDPTALIESQVGVEAFYQANNADTSLIVSHVGVEVFRSTADAFSSALIVSQVGVEVWRSSADAPVRRGGAALLVGL